MLRPAMAKDIDQLLIIEQSVHTAPWNKEAFDITFGINHRGWVVVVDDKIIGFLLAAIQLEVCHVLNIAVKREYQGQGWGSQLLEAMINEVREEGIKTIYLEVRKSNQQALALYQKWAFQLIGERKGYYPAKPEYEDALVFAKHLQV